MERFNERFKVSHNEINNNDLFIENIKINVDSIIDFNECNACKNKPNRLRVVLHEFNNLDGVIWVVVYCELCSIKESSDDYTFVEMFLQTKEGLHDFVINAVLNSKKFNLLR